MNDDDQTREAIHRVVAGAPRPVPYEQLAAEAANSKVPSNHAWLAVAAVMIVLAGVAGVVWATGRDDGASGSATEPTVEPLPSDPVTVPASDPSASTAPTASSTIAPTTVAGTVTDPGPTELFPVADGLTSFSAIAPSGSIDGAPGDIVSLSVDGDLYLHQGAFDPDQYGRAPNAPVRLVDGDDTRVPVEEGPGPNGVSWVGGFVNGALVYGDCCEPVIGNVYALSDAEGARANLRYGSSGAADTSGRRWAVADSFGVQILDFDTGHGYVRNHADDSQYNIDVLWSPDSTEVWTIAEVFGDEGSRSDVLIRYDSSSLVELGRAELVPSAGEEAPATFAFVGRTDAAVMVAEYGPDRVLLHAVDPEGRELLDEPEWSLPVGAASVHLSPDGTTVAYTLDGTAYLQLRGQAPVPWASDTSAVWFVTTPAMPRGTATCTASEVGTVPWAYADLDGDGVSERVVVRTDAPLVWFGTCGTSLSVDELETTRSSGLPVHTPVDVEADGTAEMWITWNDGGWDALPPQTVRCGSLYGLVDGVLAPLTAEHCIGPGAAGFGCSVVDGVARPVFYERDGLMLTAVLDDGTVLGSHTYESEQQMEGLFDLAC